MPAAAHAARRSLRSLARWTILLAVVLLAAVVLAANLWTGWLAHAIAYAPASGAGSPQSSDPTAARLVELGIARQLRVSVTSPPASLLVWIIDPPSDAAPTATVLVLHGIRDRVDSMLGFGRRLAGAGFRSVLVSLRGHARATGEYLTYGVHESRDLVQVVDRLEREGLIAGRIGACGFSYGGAAAIQWAALDPRARSVVAVATFASLREVVPDYLHRLLPVVGWLVTDAAVQRAIDEAGAMAGFDPDAASNVAAITRGHAPALLIHGDLDRNIPCSHSARIAAAAPERTELLVLPGEDHVSIMRDRSGVLGARAVAWLRRWLVP